MKLKLNKDFLHEYKNDAWKGFSIPEIVSICIALACNLGCTFLLWKYLHIAPDKAVYLGIPVMIPPLAIGFVKIQDNLTVIAYAKAIYDTYQCRELSFAVSSLKRNGFSLCSIVKNVPTVGTKGREEKGDETLVKSQ